MRRIFALTLFAIPAFGVSAAAHTSPASMWLLQEKNLGQVISRHDHWRDLPRARSRWQTLEDVRSLTQLSEGSQARLWGEIDGRRFRADARNHKGELDMKMKGVRFDSPKEAQAFLDSLRRAGADRIRMKGTIDRQPFDASFRDHNGRVEQRFRGAGRSGKTGHGALRKG